MSSLKLYMLTLNCAKEQVKPKMLALHLFNGLEDRTQLPDLFVLSLQELAPPHDGFLGGTAKYFDSIQDAVHIGARRVEGLPDTEPGPLKLVTSHNVGMTAVMVFAREPKAVQDLQMAEVGFGAYDVGYKAAVGVRFTYHNPAADEEQTQLTFVAAHLTAMEDAVAQRNAEWKSIVERLMFSETPAATADEQPQLRAATNGSIYSPRSHLFVAGDLNYRTSNTPPAEGDSAKFPQPHDAPGSPNHVSQLFAKDQLNIERRAGRTLHGLTEAPVVFPPTYKYRIEEPFLTADSLLQEWKWAGHRWPSWCDRILYLESPAWLLRDFPGAEITVHKYFALTQIPTSDHRGVVLSASIPLVPIPAPSADDAALADPRITPPFPTDPTWKSRRSRALIAETITGLGFFAVSIDGIALFLVLVFGLGVSYFFKRLANPDSEGLI